VRRPRSRAVRNQLTRYRLRYAAAAAAPAVYRKPAAHLRHDLIRHLAHSADPPHAFVHTARDAARRRVDSCRRRGAVHQLQNPGYDVPRGIVLGELGDQAGAVGRRWFGRLVDL
jgi:hypothetical protein